MLGLWRGSSGRRLLSSIGADPGVPFTALPKHNLAWAHCCPPSSPSLWESQGGGAFHAPTTTSLLLLPASHRRCYLPPLPPPPLLRDGTPSPLATPGDSLHSRACCRAGRPPPLTPTCFSLPPRSMTPTRAFAPAGSAHWVLPPRQRLVARTAATHTRAIWDCRQQHHPHLPHTPPAATYRCLTGGRHYAFALLPGLPTRTRPHTTYRWGAGAQHYLPALHGRRIATGGRACRWDVFHLPHWRQTRRAPLNGGRRTFPLQHGLAWRPWTWR